MYQEIALANLRESPLNPRKHSNSALEATEIGQLAESIRAVGIIEPLVVRPQNGHFEIVAGTRRFRAAQLAELAEVPTMVRELSDEQALEIMICENNQRADITPLEEAAGYRKLLDSNPAKYSAAGIADRIGRSERYVWDRMKLLDLVPEAQALLEQGRITAGHAILLARLKPETQQAIVVCDPVEGTEAGDRHALWRHEASLLDTTDERSDEGDDVEERDPYARLKACSVRELEAWIARNVRFDAPHMAQAAPLDFGETALRIEQAAAKPGRGKKVIAITYEYRVSDLARDEHERTYGRESWKRADGSDDEDAPPCEHSVLGVVATGYDYGHAFEVCVARDKCDVHWEVERREKERRQKAAAKGGRSGASAGESAHQAEQDRYKKQREREDAEREAWRKATPAIIQALGAKLERAQPAALADLVLDACDNYSHTAVRKARAILGAGKKAEDILRLAALSILVKLSEDAWHARQTLPKVAKGFGVDVAAILKAQAKSESTASAKAVALGAPPENEARPLGAKRPGKKVQAPAKKRTKR